MKRATILAAVAALAATVLASGCALPGGEQRMNDMASALTKVSAAVDATARYRRSADALDGDALLRASTAHDPQLLQPFAAQQLRLLRVQRDTAVLVCDANTGQALLEDAGCTAPLDAHRWRETPPSRCEFTLDLPAVCAR